MKRVGVAQLKRKADKYFSIYVRQRDADSNGIAQCITCPKRARWQEMQAGHFVRRSVNLLRYDEENVNAQCPGCNVFRYGEQFAYSKALDEKYGDGTAERLMSQKRETHKFTIEELMNIIEQSKVGV